MDFIQSANPSVMKVVCVDSGIIGLIFFSSSLMDSSNSEISTALYILSIY